MINLPRKTRRIGKCLALTYIKIRKGINHKLGDAIIIGRPYIFFEKGQWQASRLSYHLNKSPIPRLSKNRKQGFVLHTCDNNWCIEPKHLYLGTQKQNWEDTWSRHPTIRENKSNYMKGNKYALGKYWSDERKRKQSIIIKKKWKSGSYIEMAKSMKGNHRGHKATP